jgi:hypothetical protein
MPYAVRVYFFQTYRMRSYQTHERLLTFVKPKPMIRYIRVLFSVIRDIVKDEFACAMVDVHNFLRRFRSKPKPKEFDESEAYNK